MKNDATLPTQRKLGKEKHTHYFGSLGLKALIFLAQYHQKITYFCKQYARKLVSFAWIVFKRQRKYSFSKHYYAFVLGKWGTFFDGDTLKPKGKTAKRKWMFYVSKLFFFCFFFHELFYEDTTKILNTYYILCMHYFDPLTFITEWQ